jgi:uncharacterized protein YjeT (DUF2065 family)
MDWSTLGAAFALYLVLEGVIPFLNPSVAQRAFKAMAETPERVLRFMGLASMIGGCVLLYAIRN